MLTPSMKMEQTECSETSAHKIHALLTPSMKMGQSVSETSAHKIHALLTPSMKMEQSVPKRRHIKFRSREITQKKEYKIQNSSKFRNQEILVTTPNMKIKKNPSGCDVALFCENRRIRRSQKLFYPAALAPKKNFAGVL